MEQWKTIFCIYHWLIMNKKKLEVPLTKEKEVYNIQQKEVTGLPTITIVDKQVKSMTEWDEISISISDATAKGALDVFKNVVQTLGIETDE